MTTCQYFSGPLVEKGRGRIPVFCSDACRQAHHRFVKNGCVRKRFSASFKSLALRNVTGAGIKQSLPLRNAGSFSQVDWVETL